VLRSGMVVLWSKYSGIQVVRQQHDRHVLVKHGRVVVKHGRAYALSSEAQAVQVCAPPKRPKHGRALTLLKRRQTKIPKNFEKSQLFATKIKI